MGATGGQSPRISTGAGCAFIVCFVIMLLSVGVIVWQVLQSLCKAVVEAF